MSRRKNAGSHSDSRALPDPQADAPLLEVEGLRVSFPSEDGTVRAVRGVDLAVGRGEVLALRKVTQLTIPQAGALAPVVGAQGQLHLIEGRADRALKELPLARK